METLTPPDKDSTAQAKTTQNMGGVEMNIFLTKFFINHLKSKIMKRFIFLSAIALWLFATMSCETEEQLVNEQGTSGNDLGSTSASSPTKKSIIGTWKCIAFGDDETGKEKPIEPVDCEKCYVLTFKKDGSFEGWSAANSRNGQYNLNGKQLKFTNIGGTEVGEMGDAELFSEALWDISSYKIVGSKLFLYYSNDKYLLFKPKN